jgi:hypothetical protein
MEMNPDSVKKGVLGIKNYLTQKQLLDCPDFPLDNTTDQSVNFTVKSQIKPYYAPAGGMIQSRVELGSQVRADQPLYQLLSFNREGDLPKLIDVQAESEGLVFSVAKNHAVNEGEYVLSIM